MKYLLLVATLATLAACSGASHDDQAPPSDTPKTKTVFDPLLEQRDKAKEQAEKASAERKENVDRAVEGDSQ